MTSKNCLDVQYIEVGLLRCFIFSYSYHHVLARCYRAIRCTHLIIGSRAHAQTYQKRRDLDAQPAT
jgi:hypothetical protein